MRNSREPGNASKSASPVRSGGAGAHGASSPRNASHGPNARRNASPRRNSSISSSMEEVRRQFNRLDTNNDSMLCFADIQDLLITLNPTFSEHQLQQLFCEIDINRSGQIEFDEFFAFIVDGKRFKSAVNAGPPRSESTSTQVREEWKRQVLDLHNALRAEHGAQPVAWSDECYLKAKEQADACQAKGSLDYGSCSGPSGQHGQNAYYGLGSAPEQAIQSWYDELYRPGYDFAKPGFSHGTRHFTQVVWRGCTDIGMAASEDGCFLVANYWPAGNVQGVFEENVLPGRSAPRPRPTPKQHSRRPAPKAKSTTFRKVSDSAYEPVPNRGRSSSRSPSRGSISIGGAVELDGGAMQPILSVVSIAQSPTRAASPGGRTLARRAQYDMQRKADEELAKKVRTEQMQLGERVVRQHFIDSGESEECADKIVELLRRRNKDLLCIIAAFGELSDEIEEEFLSAAKYEIFERTLMKGFPFQCSTLQRQEVIKRISDAYSSVELAALRAGPPSSCYVDALRSAIYDRSVHFCCPLCTDLVITCTDNADPDWSNMWLVQNQSGSACGHSFCRPCISMWAEAAIDDGEWNLQCPAEGCVYPLHDQDLEELVSEEAFADHQELKEDDRQRKLQAKAKERERTRKALKQARSSSASADQVSVSKRRAEYEDKRMRREEAKWEFRQSLLDNGEAEIFVNRMIELLSNTTLLTKICDKEAVDEAALAVFQTKAKRQIFEPRLRLNLASDHSIRLNDSQLGEVVDRIMAQHTSIELNRSEGKVLHQYCADACTAAADEGSSRFSCLICMDPLVSITEKSILSAGWSAPLRRTEHWSNRPCGHVFCKPCMTSWAETAINDSKLKIRCPAVKCKYHLWDQDLQELVSPDVYSRHQEHRNTDYLERLNAIVRGDPTLMRWLKSNARPCPDCHVIVSRSEGCNVMQCVCGTRFCYACGFKDCQCGVRDRNDIWNLDADAS